MLALSICQPFAELILRGIKSAEYRTRATRVIGQWFFIYASKSPASKIWSRDLAMPEPCPGDPTIGQCDESCKICKGTRLKPVRQLSVPDERTYSELCGMRFVKPEDR